MEFMTQLKLPKALKKANGSSIQFKVGDFGEFEQKLKYTQGMLEDMPRIQMHKVEELEEGRARLM
jgi:hypothetical protein